jgi:hypothetical protein
MELLIMSTIKELAKAAAAVSTEKFAFDTEDMGARLAGSGLIGAGLGAGLGAFTEAGEDEYGKKRSRLEHILRRAALGAGLGAGVGALSPSLGHAAAEVVPDAADAGRYLDRQTMKVPELLSDARQSIKNQL